jgi:hypothetical protein
MLSGVGKFLASLFLRLALALGLFSAGANEEKKNQAVKAAKEAKNEAKKWANRPRSNNASVVRLRKLADKKRED